MELEFQIGDLLSHQELVTNYLESEELASSYLGAFARRAADWSGDTLSNVLQRDWSAADCSGAFYIYPTQAQQYRAKHAYGFIQVNERTFGAAVTLVNGNHLAWHLSETSKDFELVERLNKQFYYLRDLAYQEKLENVEVAELYRILD